MNGFMTDQTTIRAGQIQAMAKVLADNTDDIVDVLGINLDGFDNKMAGLLANFLMDLHDGRQLEDPGHVVAAKIKDAEMHGSPIVPDDQDIMAQWAMERMRFWNGQRFAKSYAIIWTMLQQGCFPLQHGKQWSEAVGKAGHDMKDDMAVMSAMNDLIRTAKDLCGMKAVPARDFIYAADPGYHDGDYDADRAAVLDAMALFCKTRDGYYAEWNRAAADIAKKYGIDAYDIQFSNAGRAADREIYDAREAMRRAMSYYHIPDEELDSAIKALA